MKDPTAVQLARVRMEWDVKIPMRDGVNLNSTLYMPEGARQPGPAIFTLTPYIGQMWHEVATYFAALGFPFLTVDARGRGNSQGVFKPNINEARDGYDIIEWLSHQSYCNGKVGMWGGSYAGYSQWAAAKEFPPHLATIVPVASPCFGVDFPLRSNVAAPYLMQWLTFVWGRALQGKIFADQAYWRERFREWFEGGHPFRGLDTFLGNPSAIFQEWVSHPRRDEYWDSYNPTSQQYSRLTLPILTITGVYDGDQPGALAHYREHMRHTSSEARSRHYLVIGPWDHAGTRTPCSEFGGLKFGPASLVDLPKLHVQWYAWTMQGGAKPEFLQKNVAYYVSGAEKWRYADTLEAVTERLQPLYLQSKSNPTDVFHSGMLSTEQQRAGEPDQYRYDPRDVSHARLESLIESDSRVDQRLLHALSGKQLVYHSEPFERDTEISGFFRLSVWLSIDQPDTAFRVSVHEIALDGSSIELTSDWLRARYRESLREQKLIETREALRYDFDGFMFASRQIRQGHRLRLVIGPLNSIHWQRVYNSAAEPSEESMRDAREVTVLLLHDEAHPSALYVPLGRLER